MTKQDEIIKTIALRYGISYSKGLEIWECFCNTIGIEMSKDLPLTENNEIDITKMPVIHITNFGKFYPHQQVIKAVNKRKNKKQ